MLWLCSASTCTVITDSVRPRATWIQISPRQGKVTKVCLTPFPRKSLTLRMNAVLFLGSASCDRCQKKQNKNASGKEVSSLVVVWNFLWDLHCEGVHFPRSFWGIWEPEKLGFWGNQLNPYLSVSSGRWEFRCQAPWEAAHPKAGAKWRMWGGCRKVKTKCKEKNVTKKKKKKDTYLG